MNGEVEIGRPSSANGHFQQHSQDKQMRRCLFAACKRPTSLSDIKSFQNLHNPRIHSMTEWILQYESARQSQDLCLLQSRELRQRFSKKGRSEKPETGSKPKRFWSPAWDPMTGMACEDNWLKRKGYRTLPKETCVLFTKMQQPKTRLTRPDYWNSSYYMEAPTSTLQSIRGSKSKRIESGTSNISSSKNGNGINPLVEGGRRIKLPSIGSPGSQNLDRNQTDYEPIENISRRNKLNLTNYLQEERARSSSRQSIDMSDVLVQATPIPCSR